MINKELDAIMTDYVKKVSEFCRAYENDVIKKGGCKPFSHYIEVVFSNFERELWKMKSDTEELLYMANDKFITCGDTTERVAKEMETVKRDLNTMHKCYMNRYAAHIAEALAKQWAKAGDAAFWALVKNAAGRVSINEGGVEV